MFCIKKKEEVLDRFLEERFWLLMEDLGVGHCLVADVEEYTKARDSAI